MRTLVVPSLALLAACGGAFAPASPPGVAGSRPFVAGPPLVPDTWAPPGRVRPVRGGRAMVVSGHPLATRAGVRVLRAGGNAIDAAVAVGLALAVVLPEAGNLGGGGFLLYRDAGGAVHALDYRETAPGAATPMMYVDTAGNPTDASLTGHRAAGVPGSPAGLYEMWRAHGRLPWARLVAPAIRLAEGHRLDSVRSDALADGAERLARFPASAAQFLPGGRAPPRGGVFRQPDLARTLRLLADSGPAAFYEGEIAGRIAAEMARGGGMITAVDLAAYRAKWRTPVTVRYRGYTIHSMPPPSSGGVTLGQVLNVMEGFDTLPAFGSRDHVHLTAEAMRRAFLDRNRWLGDPDFVELPLERLLSKAYAAELRGQIDPTRATPTPAVTAGGAEGVHTTHYSVVDADGNAAAVTTTINGGFGSAVTVAGAGFLLNNEMDDFTTAPGRPNQFGLVQGEANAIAPHKRMLSAMAPTIVLDPEGRLFLVAGTPGGPTIITSVYQVITNVVDHRMPLAAAVAAPRIHHQALPDEIRYEPGGLAAETVAALRAMGHRVEERRSYSGDIAAIMRDARGGWIGVADPRRGGRAAGW